MRENNKKIYINILCTMFFIVVFSAVAHAEAPIGTNGAGVYGQMEKEQIKNFEIEKNVVAPVEKIKPSKSDAKFEMNVKKDLQKDGVTYNPKFKVEKIKFVGNTKVKTKILESFATDIVGQEIYLEDLLVYALKVSRYYQSRDI